MTKSELSKTKWAFVFLFFDISLGRWDILPNFAGFLLLWIVAGSVGQGGPSGNAEGREGRGCAGGMGRRLRPFLGILCADDLLHWLIPFSNALESMLIMILFLYTVYVFLGLLADLVAERQAECARKIRRYGTASVILYTLAYLGLAFGLGWLAVVASLGMAVVDILLLIILNAVTPTEETLSEGTV